MKPGTDGGGFRGYPEALGAVLRLVPRMGVAARALPDALGCVISGDVEAAVSSPGEDASLMDGYALSSAPVPPLAGGGARAYRVVGSAVAGRGWPGVVGPGEAVRITTGAPIPSGADRVVASEEAAESGGVVAVSREVERGLNVLARGADITAGEVVASAGTVLSPPVAGKLAAAGIERVNAVARPRVSMIAVGDEVVAPGGVLGQGQLFASNLIGLSAWLGRLGFPCSSRVVGDDESALAGAMEDALESADAVVTCGGAWTSWRDPVVPLLDRVGWDLAFRGVRMGPGKGTAFGVCRGKPVFCLPGGPPAAEIAFLELVAPGLAAMAGRAGPVFPEVAARYSGRTIRRRSPDWTDFVRGRLRFEGEEIVAEVGDRGGRLDDMVRADCVVVLGEGDAPPADGDVVRAQWIYPPGLP